MEDVGGDEDDEEGRETCGVAFIIIKIYCKKKNENLPEYHYEFFLCIQQYLALLVLYD